MSRISVPHLGRLIPRETISSAHWVSTAYVRVRDIDYDDSAVMMKTLKNVLDARDVLSSSLVIL